VGHGAEKEGSAQNRPKGINKKKKKEFCSPLRGTSD
jgi:hypothetical protein